jgi:RNA polymerase sigma factor (sigma-70 family)
MAKAPPTRPSLLLRLRDARDGAAWSEFVEVYAPLVYGYARKQGLQDADAADVTQEVLRAVSGAMGRLEYDPERGSFRGWLFTIVRNKLRSFLAGPKGQARGGTSAQLLLEAQPGPAEATAWDAEYEQRLFAWAADQVRGGFEDATWRAFWRTAVEGRAPKEVAAELGLTVGAVYIAKSRVLARLRERVRDLQGE